MIAVIDNYDSFTWNLVQYLRELGRQVTVFRNDAIGVQQLVQLDPDAILLSPGPGTPDGAGITLEAIHAFAGSRPLFGVCLGQQAIGQAYGGVVVQAQRIMHGKVSEVHHDGSGVFEGLPSPFRITRYHSLVIQASSLPPSLTVTAWTLDANGEREEIMGLRHRELDVEGVQFHPESIESEHGHALLERWLQRSTETS